MELFCCYTAFPLLGFYLASHGDGMSARLGLALMAVALAWIVCFFFLPIAWFVVRRM